MTYPDIGAAKNTFVLDYTVVLHTSRIGKHHQKMTRDSMIQYALKCNQEHRFDSWFQSASAFDKLKAADMVTCPVCGVSQVDKCIMTPRVGKKGNQKADPSPPNGNPQTSHAPHLTGTKGTGPNLTTAKGGRPSLTAPATAAEHAIAELRKHVEENADYVGGNFADEARAMHDGSSPERAIYGEAQPDQARALIDEGIHIAPLPFAPVRKAN